MDKLEELKKKYKELGEEIEKLENESKVWKPENGEQYWYLTSDGDMDVDDWGDWECDNARYEIGNCFKTETEAEVMLEKFQIYTELKRLAEEINIEPIDWDNFRQNKYRIKYNNCDKRLECEYMSYIQHFGIYSTNPDFLEIALERIGRDRLLKLFKE